MNFGVICQGHGWASAQQGQTLINKQGLKDKQGLLGLLKADLMSSVSFFSSCCSWNSTAKHTPARQLTVHLLPKFRVNLPLSLGSSSAYLRMVTGDLLSVSKFPAC